mgnify:CR=1 FL=1
MTGFSLAILTPDREGYRGSVESVTAPGQDGEFGVLANHMPLVAGLKSGVALVREAGGRPLYFAIDGGVLGVDKSGARILAGRVAPCPTLESARKAAADFARKA